MKTYLLPFLFYFFAISANAQVGSLDPVFGDNGIRLFPAAPQDAAYVIKVIPAPGKQFFVIYSSFDEQVKVAKFSAAGIRDGSFGSGGYSQPIPINVSDAYVQADGKLLLAGRTIASYHPDIHDDLMVVRLNPDGTLDQTFNDDGILTATYTPFSYEFVNSVVVEDDRILIGGYSISLVGQFAGYHYDVYDLQGNTVSRVHLGFIDGLENYSPADHQYWYALQDKNVIVSSVNYDAETGTYISAIERFDRDGLPVAEFGNGGKLLLDRNFFQGPLLVVAEEDKLVVGSHSLDPLTNQYGFALERFTNTGSPDLSFNNTGKQFTSFNTGTPVTPTAIFFDNDKLYVGGNTVNPQSGKVEFVLARYNADGTLDQQFAGDGKQITGIASYHLALETITVIDHRLVIAGKAAIDPGDPATFKGVVAVYILEKEPPITMACPSEKIVSTAPGRCTAIVTNIDPVLGTGSADQTVIYTLSGATNKMGKGSVSGLAFNKGTTDVVYSQINNPALKCSFKVTVFDKESPVVSNVAASQTSLWPPNHKMVDVYLSYDAKDNCGVADTILSVWSNETNRGSIQQPDWQVINKRQVRLRAEKGKSPKERVYTIEVRVKDASGNQTFKTVNVRVAKDKSQQFSKEDDGVGSNGLAVHVQPNPADDQFTIFTTSEVSLLLRLRVMDASGRIVETKSNLAANGQVQIGRQYRAGLYIAEFTQGTTKVIVKLIKQ